MSPLGPATRRRWRDPPADAAPSVATVARTEVRSEQGWTAVGHGVGQVVGGTAVRRGGRRHSVDVVTHLVAREFRLRYRRSLLGVAWSIVQPLARLVVLAFVFTQ